MDRRQFIVGVTGCLASMSLNARSRPEQQLPLWSKGPPGGGGPQGPIHRSSTGAVSNIRVPLLTCIAPQNPNGSAVLVAAGGGYRHIEMGKEAWPAAQWLAQRGFTAYILTYRLPAEGWHDGPLVALQDAQRALRVINSRHDRCSVLGFSAGGHLLGIAVDRPDFQSYPLQDATDNVSARAQCAALIYPIITLEPPYTHTSTHKMLVGPKASLAQDQRWSVQNYVTPQSPPFFLVQAEDDPVSNPHNTLIMQQACLKAGVPVELHRYPTGGHGFGLGRPGTETVQWPAHYQRWLTSWLESTNR